MVIRAVDNPPRVIIEWLDKHGREPYIINSSEEALQAYLQLLEAVKIFDFKEFKSDGR